jgi:hypothetical protein
VINDEIGDLIHEKRVKIALMLTQYELLGKIAPILYDAAENAEWEENATTRVIMPPNDEVTNTLKWQVGVLLQAQIAIHAGDSLPLSLPLGALAVSGTAGTAIYTNITTQPNPDNQLIQKYITLQNKHRDIDKLCDKLGIISQKLVNELGNIERVATLARSGTRSSNEAAILMRSLLDHLKSELYQAISDKRNKKPSKGALWDFIISKLLLDTTPNGLQQAKYIVSQFSGTGSNNISLWTELTNMAKDMTQYSGIQVYDCYIRFISLILSFLEIININLIKIGFSNSHSQNCLNRL